MTGINHPRKGNHMKTRLSGFVVGATMYHLAGLPVGVCAEPFFHQKDLCISGINNVNNYRIPTLLVSPKGTILAFCEARDGDDGAPTDIVLKQSVYSGQTPTPRNLNGFPRIFGYGVSWGRMQAVVPGKGQATMQNTPLIDRDTGTILL